MGKMSAEDEQKLLEIYPHCDINEILAALPTATISRVNSFRQKYGLTKTASTRSRINLRSRQIRMEVCHDLKKDDKKIKIADRKSPQALAALKQYPGTWSGGDSRRYVREVA